MNISQNEWISEHNLDVAILHLRQFRMVYVSRATVQRGPFRCCCLVHMHLLPWTDSVQFAKNFCVKIQQRIGAMEIHWILHDVFLIQSICAICKHS